MERKGKLQGVVCGSLRHDLSEHIKRHAEAAKVAGGYKPGLMVCSDAADVGIQPAVVEVSSASASNVAAPSAEGGATTQQSSRVAMMAESPATRHTGYQDLTTSEVERIMESRAVYGTSGVSRFCMMGDAYCRAPCPCVNCPDRATPEPREIPAPPPPPPHEVPRPPRPENVTPILRAHGR